MSFDEETIRGVDESVLSRSEKRWLIDKFFPKSGPAPWQEKLATEWDSAKRWERYLEAASIPDPQTTYRVSHSELVRRAKRHEPTRIGRRVTDFTAWVFSLYCPPPDPQAQADGKKVERSIAKRLGGAPARTGWELIYQDPLVSRPDPMTISALTIDGHAIYGAPDLVFREKQSGRIIIVERKASNRPIPSDGWPNLRAQLWAYAQADEWFGAPEIDLVGEIWGYGYGSVSIRGVCKWSLRDRQFCRENAELFSIYRDHVEGN